MKPSILLVALATAFAGAALAQPAAPSTPAAMATAKASAPAAPANAGATTMNGVCKDGTTVSGDSLKGACRGHGGLDKKAGAAPATAKAPASKPAAAPAAQAPGGGAGKVWANESSKVYHCEGDKYYGKTKQGEYMTEADAKAKGFHGDHGKTCAK